MKQFEIALNKRHLKKCVFMPFRHTLKQINIYYRINYGFTFNLWFRRDILIKDSFMDQK